MNKKITAADRSTFTTTISKDLQKQFRIACINQGKHMNQVLETFMKEYIKENEK